MSAPMGETHPPACQKSLQHLPRRVFLEFSSKQMAGWQRLVPTLRDPGGVCMLLGVACRNICIEPSALQSWLLLEQAMKRRVRLSWVAALPMETSYQIRIHNRGIKCSGMCAPLLGPLCVGHGHAGGLISKPVRSQQGRNVMLIRGAFLEMWPFPSKAIPFENFLHMLILHHQQTVVTIQCTPLS